MCRGLEGEGCHHVSVGDDMLVLEMVADQLGWMWQTIQGGGGRVTHQSSCVSLETACGANASTVPQRAANELLFKMDGVAFCFSPARSHVGVFVVVVIVLVCRPPLQHSTT